MAKVKILPYNQNFQKIFGKKKREISQVIQNCKIYHIGSTAVPNLGGKGIIDIMIAINDFKKVKNVIERLKDMGFTHIHPEEEGRIFLSTEKETKIGSFHIHLVEKGGEAHKELLFFRDYLRENREEAEKYFKLKLKWKREAKEERSVYTKLKTDYIKSINEKNKR